MTVRKGLGQANILRTNNNTSTGYGIAYADEVSGHRTVANLTALYALNDWQLSASGDNTNSDAVGQLWYVVDADGNGNGALYQLKDWSKRNEAAGWSEFKGTGASTAAAITFDNAASGMTAVTVQAAIDELSSKLKNAGYFYAGIATPITNPGTPDGSVFYIANGKGIYANFGGLEVTENDVVILYYDTVWHKVSTGIASNEKLTELELEYDDIRKLSEQAEYNAGLVSQVVTPIDEDTFVVTDSNGNVVIRYNENGLDVTKVSQHMVEMLGDAKLVTSAEVVEDGFFIVDNTLNIGLGIDGKGTHSKNLVEI